jgi:hypothetical protein
MTSLRQYVTVLLDDVRKDITQPADRDPLLEQGNRLLAKLAG